MSAILCLLFIIPIDYYNMRRVTSVFVTQWMASGAIRVRVSMLIAFLWLCVRIVFLNSILFIFSLN